MVTALLNVVWLAVLTKAFCAVVSALNALLALLTVIASSSVRVAVDGKAVIRAVTASTAVSLPTSPPLSPDVIGGVGGVGSVVGV